MAICNCKNFSMKDYSFTCTTIFCVIPISFFLLAVKLLLTWGACLTTWGCNCTHTKPRYVRMGIFSPIPHYSESSRSVHV